MKTKFTKWLLCPVLAAALLTVPLPSLDAAVYAASAPAAATAAAAKDVSVYVDGKKLSLSASAYAQNGVTFVPMRDIFSALNARLTWEPTTKTIIGRKGLVTLSLSVGDKEAIVNGKPVKLDAAPVMKNGVTFVPARFVAQSLGAKVAWDNAANAVRITSAEAAYLEEYEELEEEKEQLPKLTTKEIVDKYDQSVVMITTNIAQGSGVVIGDRLILTNHHVIVEASSATALTIDGDIAKITGVVAYNENSDLAIIKTEDPIGMPAVEIGYGFDAVKGDKVVAIGSPLGVQNTVSEGLISNITYEAGVRYIQTNAPFDHGSSGGALFSETGELIGITAAGIENTQAHLNYAVSIMHAAFLAETVTDEMVANAKFLPPSLPDTLVGVPLSDVQKLMKDQYSSVQFAEGAATFKDWKVERDSEGWLVISAVIDPIFYMYYGPASADELRIWSINLGYELNRMLPDEKIQFIVNYDRVLEFEPRGYGEGEVTPAGDGKWRLRFAVIDMQVKDQLVIQVRD